MTLKKKLILLLSVLFMVIITSIGLSGYFVNRLAENSREIVNDNYRSLVYVQEMQQILDQVLMKINSSASFNQEINHFKTVLDQQSANITETGEATLTDKLNLYYQDIQQHLNPSDLTAPPANNTAIRQSIFEAKNSLNTIFKLNEKAVEMRNQKAAKAADDAILFSSLFALTAILVTIFYIFQIPNYLVKPIQEITRQMQAISNRNYKVSVNENRKDEFQEMAVVFNKMAHRLETFEAGNMNKLMTERNRLNAVVEQFDIPILGISESNKVLFANDRMLRIIEQKKESIQGKNLMQLCANNDLLKLLTENNSPENERQLIRIILEGNERLFSKRMITTDTVIPNKNYLTHDRLIILNDVTDFIQKDVMKTQFMATLSHELKTPVAAIEMSTDLLFSKKVGNLNEEQQEYVTKINDQASRIRRMVNEVLELSKIESGTIDFDLENVEVSFLVQEAIETIKPFLNHKNITIETQISDNLPPINVDSHKVLWTLNNFLTNAIRYTPNDGTIKVVAFFKNKSIGIEVTDNGPGINIRDQKRIFEKYVRINKNEKGGTGLGLAISKEFIEAMGGSIGVRSEENKGATFWVKLNTT
ncbi:sensor histidine kinase [Zunongwangia profunda]|uniref:sensor histidine kinase n=1 Tax=Zunongwangia profunda TaxID=398743 RepID=UPI000C904E62|nr:ATP-binding protein [Zunongwangia profunda]MAG88184.1 hypothetical protein [Flavobacteriaceae bacterium]MCC4229513.1 HAMP domain-containing protein [Zunongwangia profunda]|tara:strand:+ start:12471 stop:14243 length:1773 start_codon:yes stop_codon:yes gene_type:complete